MAIMETTTFETRESIHPSPMDEIWPSLPLEAWVETCQTLHRWMQIVGKVRLKLAPMMNHWWQVAFYVTPRGLSTSSIPYRSHVFEMEFDFLDHVLRMVPDTGETRFVPLSPRSVADFYFEVTETLHLMGIDVQIWTTPVEVEDRTSFEQDDTHAAYDPEYAQRFWRLLVQTDRVLKEFRGRYAGKASPVHFFWGAFDLAATRFSGRPAPTHPGTPNVKRSVMVEAYCQEVSSCGFWPGMGLGVPAFYAYAYPEPEGFAKWPIRPAGAYYHPDLREFILPYETVRRADDPDRSLMAFLQTTYEAAAVLGGWDRTAVDRRMGEEAPSP
jgi:hypothetical protein